MRSQMLDSESDIKILDIKSTTSYLGPQMSGNGPILDTFWDTPGTPLGHHGRGLEPQRATTGDPG